MIDVIEEETVAVRQQRKSYTGTYNEDIYWERINRNLGWLGSTEKEQRQRQEKLRNTVVGVAGCGGIGGGFAERFYSLVF